MTTTEGTASEVTTWTVHHDHETGAVTIRDGAREVARVADINDALAIVNAQAARAITHTRDDLARAAAEVQAEALDEAADVWQRGAWADAPRKADRIQERIANGQYVTDWLRDRARIARGDVA